MSMFKLKMKLNEKHAPGCSSWNVDWNLHPRRKEGPAEERSELPPVKILQANRWDPFRRLANVDSLNLRPTMTNSEKCGTCRWNSSEGEQTPPLAAVPTRKRTQVNELRHMFVNYIADGGCLSS
jgi:hypothetical protein